MTKLQEILSKYPKQVVFGSIALNLTLIILLSLVMLMTFLTSQKPLKSTFESDNAIKSISSTSSPITSAPAISKQNSLVIEVLGQVQNPGIYFLNEPIMVISAIEKAGGTTSLADMDYLHKDLALSKMVYNNQKIYIPRAGESQSSSSNSASGSNDITDPISINSSSQSQLESLPYVGETIAKRIVDGRPYSQLADLKNIAGITENIYNNIVTLIAL